MKRHMVVLAIVVTMAVAAVMLLMGAVGAAGQETSRVRLVHALPIGLTVDVYVDDALVEQQVAYRDVTSYTVLSAGTHTVEARTAYGAISQTVYLTGGMDVTVIGVGSSLFDAQAIALQDDNHLANAGKFRVVHLSPNTGAMDVFLAAEAAAVVGGLEYQEATDYFGGIGAGVLSVQVRVGGAYKTLVPSTTTLQSNAIHTLFIMGTGDSLDLVATVDQQFEGAGYKVFLPLVTKTGAGG